MMTILGIILAIIMVAVLFKVFMPKTGQALSNTSRGLDGQIADALANPIRDGQIAIEDARKELRELTQTVAELVAANNKLELDYKAALSDINKFENLAKLAVVLETQMMCAKR